VEVIAMRRNRWAYWLLLVPFLALLLLPIYAHVDPELAGIPFFIWWPFLWALLTAALTFLVFRLQTADGRR
jgi:hypothetical protein